MERVSARELETTARVVDGLVYVAGVAGVVAGALLFRERELAFAVIVWALTFVAGAVLRLVAACARALAHLLVEAERSRRELELLAADRPPAAPEPGRERGGRGGPPDPWQRWGGWH